MYNEQVQNMLSTIFSDVNKISIGNITEEERNRIHKNLGNVTGKLTSRPNPVVLMGYLNGFVPFIITNPQDGTGCLDFQTEKTLQKMYFKSTDSEKYNILIDADGTNIQKMNDGISVEKTTRDQNGYITHNTKYMENFGVIKNANDSKLISSLKSVDYSVTNITEDVLKEHTEHSYLSRLFESDTRYMSKKTYWDDYCTIEIGYYWNGEIDLLEGKSPQIIYGSIEEKNDTKKGTRIFAFGLNQNNVYESIGVTSTPKDLVSRLNYQASYEQIYGLKEVQEKLGEHEVDLFHSNLFIELRKNKIKPPVITNALVSYLKAANYISSLGGTLEGTVKFDGIEINNSVEQKTNNYSI